MATKSANKDALAALRKAIRNTSDWTPVPNTKETLEESLEKIYPGLYKRITSAEVITVKFDNGGSALRIKLSTNVPDEHYELSLSSKSTLEDGDDVDVSSIYSQYYSKPGEDNICRFDGDAL
jgi:hypothetical protein